MKTFLALVLIALLATVCFGQTSHSVTLNWVASASTGITGYNVYRSTVSGGPYSQINTGLASCCTFTDTIVTAGATYFYVVRAYNGTDESANSNEAKVVIPKHPIHPLHYKHPIHPLH